MSINLKIEDKDWKEFINEKLTNPTPDPWDVSIEMVNFFKDRFREQGWLDESFERWEPVAGKTTALIDSGRLWNSIRVFNITGDLVEVGTNEPYAKIHNEGGVINVTSKQRGFFWTMYGQTKDSKWKAMALSNRLRIPKRQFMGKSKTLMKKIADEWVSKQTFRGKSY